MVLGFWGDSRALPHAKQAVNTNFVNKMEKLTGRSDNESTPLLPKNTNRHLLFLNSISSSLSPYRDKDTDIISLKQIVGRTKEWGDVVCGCTSVGVYMWVNLCENSLEIRHL